MAFSTETVGKWLAEGRNYTSMILGFATGIGFMSAGDQKGLTDALGQMYQGATLIVSGATSFYQILIVAFPIVGVVIAKWAKKSATVDNQAAAVKAAIADPNTNVSTQTKAIIVDAAVDAGEIKQPIKVDKEIADASQSNLVIAK